MTHPHRPGFNAPILGSVVPEQVHTRPGFSPRPAWPVVALGLMFLGLNRAPAETPTAGNSGPGITASATVETATPAPAAGASASADPVASVPATAAARPRNMTSAPSDLPQDPGSTLAAAASPASDSSPASATGPAVSTSLDTSSSLNTSLGAAGPEGQAVNATGAPNAPGPTPAARRAPVTMKYIPPGYSVQEPLSADDKVQIGLRDLYSPLNFAAMFASAGYEQLFNEAPNYGVDRGAFGERLGAAAIRETTQGVFTDAIFSPLLREDPRYYIEGPQYTFFHRTFYAITRPFVTRDDNGHRTINGGLLLGYAAASGLSYTYYPAFNQNARDTVGTFGSGIGGAALGYFVSEFSGDVLHLLHIGKQP